MLDRTEREQNVRKGTLVPGHSIIVYGIRASGYLSTTVGKKGNKRKTPPSSYSSRRLGGHRALRGPAVSLRCTIDYLDFSRRPLIEPAQVGLPAHGDQAREDAPEMRRDIHEAEGGHRGPELDAVRNTLRNSPSQALAGLCHGCTG